MIIPILSLLLNQGNTLLGKEAPGLIGKEWLNTEKPVKLSDRKGKVTLVYFWTFACSNCKNNMPAIKNLNEAFKKEGLETISIHTPELKEERDIANVKKAIEKNGIKYPVLIDGDYANWKAWQTNVWPCLYVLDKHNRVRGGWQGELNYNNQDGEGKMTLLIKQLLKEQ